MPPELPPRPTADSSLPLLVTAGPEVWQAIIESTHERIVIVDEALRVIDANNAFFREAGGSDRDVRGSSLLEIGDGRWNVPRFRELVASVLAGAVIEEVEVTTERRGASPLVFVVNARRLPLDGEPSPLVLLALADISERRRAERAAALYARQLERSNRELEDFAHAASHDLQEPLRKVRAFADRLVGSLDPAQLDARQRDYVARLQDAAQRMQVRIDDLLRLARVSRQWPKREPTDLRVVLDRVLNDLAEQLADADVVVDMDGSLPVEASGAHMELLFQNLIGNAVKFRRSDARSRIHVSVQRTREHPSDARDWIRLRVSDNGIGFDPQFAERIFKPFERLHGRTEYPGTGVGLSIVQRVAELYGGSVTAAQSSANGAIFDVLLPVTQPAEVE